MTLLDIDPSAVASMPLADVIAAAKDTPEFKDADQLEKMLAPEIVDLVVKFIHDQKDKNASKDLSAAREGTDQFVPLEPGYKHVTYKEAQDPQAALRDAGYADKKEAVAMLESLRREQILLEAAKKEHEARIQECERREATILGRERSLDEKSKELLEIKRKNRLDLEKISAAKSSIS